MVVVALAMAYPDVSGSQLAREALLGPRMPKPKRTWSLARTGAASPEPPSCSTPRVSLSEIRRHPPGRDVQDLHERQHGTAWSPSDQAEDDLGVLVRRILAHSRSAWSSTAGPVACLGDQQLHRGSVALSGSDAVVRQRGCRCTAASSWVLMSQNRSGGSWPAARARRRPETVDTARDQRQLLVVPGPAHAERVPP